MAPQGKRARDTREDDVVVSVEGATSSLRQNIVKKARLSGPSLKSALTNERDNSDSDHDRTAARSHQHEVLPMTQYEIDRDGDFSHLDHEEEDDILATQKLFRQKDAGLVLGDNRAAENGIMISVTMINFMCHERLHVDLGPLINFIVGENGTGKSTILSAITLCLGGKASTTNRGGALKDFVKSDCEHSSIVVKIKNEGADAYQSSIYGDVITIERNFSRAGASSFKLKSVTGRIISNKKADVDDLTEYFQMQIDNPMAILSQDAAREFLNTTKPEQKYKHFIRGVQLEQLDNDYRLVQETADSMGVKLQGQDSNLKRLEKIAKDAMRRKKAVDGRLEMRGRRSMLAAMACWVQVKDEEERLERYQTNLEVARTGADGVTQMEAAVAHADEAFQAADSKLEELRAKIAELNDDTRAAVAAERAKEAYDIANNEVKTMHTEHRQIRECLKTAQNKVRSYERELSTEMSRREELDGGGYTRKQEEFATAEADEARLKDELEVSLRRGEILEEQRRAAARAFDASKTPLDAKRAEIKTCEQKIEHMNRESGSVMNGQDPKIPQLLSMIAEEGGFQSPPIGPIGRHITLKKPQWSNAIEKALGGVLSGFIVTSKADQQRLSSMTKRLGLQCSILIGNTQIIDTRPNEPDAQFETVDRVLDIDNDVVRRQLVITQSIEQLLLIEDLHDAERTMYHSGKPRNVKQCFALNKERRGWAFILRYMNGTSDPNLGPMEPPSRAPRMKTDLESRVRMEKATLAQLRDELGVMQQEQRRLHQAVQRCAQDIKQHSKDHSAASLSCQRAEEKRERLRDELESGAVESGKLESIQGYLKEAVDEATMYENTYGEAALQKDQLNIAAATAKAALEEAKILVADHEAVVKKIADKERRTSQVRAMALQDKNAAIERLEGARSIVSNREGKVRAQLDRVAEFIEGASKVCPRVEIPENETGDSINAKLGAITEAIKSAEQKQGGSDTEVVEAAEAAQLAFESATEQYADLRELYQTLKLSYAQRLQMWKKFQRHVSARARMNFMYLLSERGFRGKLKLDHRAKLLELQVEPDATVRSADGRQTKTLSGGEKSFSSVCLLLSLWEAMGAPLRCLDEFDVFMDAVNKDISTNLIAQAARRSVGKQYILITPNSIGGGVEHGKDVKIIKLMKAKGGQPLITDALGPATH